MKEIWEAVPDVRAEQIAIDTLDRYSGSPVEDFQEYLLLTNFPKYVEFFADMYNVRIHSGSMFQVAHNPKKKISILDFKIGSPAAALVIDLCNYLPIKAGLLLGMCAGLRKHYQVGEYFVPVGAIRGEGTSDFYFPPEVPAMASFLVQKIATNVLDQEGENYHIGITHTTNKRFWEFNKEFCSRLEATRPQALEMECATLFMASYRYKFPMGALLLISDLPLAPGKKGVKTKKDANNVYKRFTSKHVELGVKMIEELDEALKHEPKGVFRGPRRRFEKYQK